MEGRIGVPRLRGAAVGLLVVGALVMPAAAQEERAVAAALAAKVEASVAAEVQRAGRADIVVVLAGQADLRAAHSMADADARGWYVYRALREQARRTQGPLCDVLDRAGVPYRRFWGVNALTTTADASLLAALARRPEVRRIESNRPEAWIVDPPVEALVLGPAEESGIEWGVNNVNAPAVWALGYTGQGIVIGIQDTGVAWTHPALRAQYRGWNGTAADHDYNWRDAIHAGGGICGADSPEPCDDGTHGTHVLGSSVGTDGGANHIGVAPGARWIGCRNMDQGVGTPATYLECFEFFLAPTRVDGSDPDPARRPHVMNNSWACPPSEGCALVTLQAAVEHAEAAGIFVVASAGNSGPSCGSVVDPPAPYAATFTVGAINSGNVVAHFSSRGPVLADGSGRLKPDLVAPGVSVRSALPGGSYGLKSGTSMASPHVAGVVALLWSARPELARDIPATRDLLRSTASPVVTVTPAQTCGGISTLVLPNNAAGHGRIDALAAVLAAASPTASATASPSPTPTATVTPATAPTPTPTPAATPGTLTLAGRVRLFAGERPVPGVTVTAAGAGGGATVTDAGGVFAFVGLPPGTRALLPSRLGGLGTAVTALDASYVLQAVVGARTLDGPQRLAGDVTGNGGLSALDASEILRFAVGLVERFPAAVACGSDWLFEPRPAWVPDQRVTMPAVNVPDCQPGAITYEPLGVPGGDQDFVAVPIGDVTGSWQPNGGALSREEAAGAFRLGRPRRRGGGLDVPLVLDPAALAGEASLAYDRGALVPRGVRRPRAEALLLAANLDEPGRVRLAAARPRAAGPAVVLVRFVVADGRRAGGVRLQAE